MVVWAWAGWGRGSLATIAALFAVSGGAGCILDNPRYDGDVLGTESESDSAGASTTTVGGTASESASDTSTGGESATGTTTTGEPTTTAPTTGEVTTGATTTTATSEATSASSDSDSDASTSGGEACAEEEKVDAYADGDMDGYGGDALGTFCPSDVPAGAALNGGDCNDGDDKVNPGVDESCDGADNNCNGLIDEYSPANTQCDLIGTCYLTHYGGHFYYACDFLMSPADPANDACKALATGGAKGYHAKIDDADERAALAGIVDKLSGDPSIGLVDTSVFNKLSDHRWVADDAALSYGGEAGVEPWAPGQPDKLSERRHMMQRGTLLWFDIDGLELGPYLCEAEPG
ncbi:MAG: MopE-related protein [Nannocystaceae bacterium]